MRHLYSLIAFTVSVLSSSYVWAEITLPPPSRTVFKCDASGKAIYSDSPCLGAQKINVEPTRGLNKSTGRELVGSDVRQEKQREELATAIKPITGMDAKQFGTFGRRMKLTSEAQKECSQLDIKIPTAEKEETSPNPEALAQSQATLLVLRKRFREIRC